VLFRSTDFADGFLTIESSARGGEALSPTGLGGSATGGPISVDIRGSTVNLTEQIDFDASATGGAGGGDPGGVGGQATSGEILMFLENADFSVTANQSAPGILNLSSKAFGGSGAVAGNATSARVILDLFASSLTVDQLVLDATAIVGGAGTALGGEARLDVAGASQVFANLIEINATAATGGDGTSQGGTASLSIAQDSPATIAANDLILMADGAGADPLRFANAPGQFLVNVEAGNINVLNLIATSTGDVLNTSQSPSALIANGGNINVTGNLIANVFGNLRLQTGQGGIIGSQVNTATTTAMNIFASGLIEIAGDDDGVVGVGGAQISLAASAIDILPGARIGANAVALNSINTDFTAILGGITEGEGFSLTGDEVRRINANTMTITVPEVRASSDPHLPDLLIRDLSFSGSLNGGFSAVRIAVGDSLAGIARIEGDLAYIDADIADLLAITAGERIELVTPGSIRISDNNDGLGGQLLLRSGYIWAADLATISDLQVDPDFAGRDALLAVAATGSDDPLGYIRAGDLDIALSVGMLVRNTGTATEQGGILVGDGGLSIIGFDPSPNQGANQSTANAAPLDVFAYGRRLTASGTFVTGEDFFREINFNRAGNDPTTYSATSAFNDCIINTGDCPQSPPPPPPPPPPGATSPSPIRRRYSRC
jgi:hypothetical protein